MPILVQTGPSLETMRKPTGLSSDIAFLIGPSTAKHSLLEIFSNQTQLIPGLGFCILHE